MNKKLSLEELNRKDISEFKASKKNNICVILDNIRSAVNVGGMFRTCDAFAIEHLYLGGICPKPPHLQITKTAIGATLSVNWSHHENLIELCEKLKSEGWTLLALEQTAAAVLLQDVEWKPSEKYAIIIGNEVNGVDQNLIDLANFSIEIPQFGTKHSLNATTSASIVLWDCLTNTALN